MARGSSTTQRVNKAVWLAEPVVALSLSFAIIGLVVRIAIESPNAADRIAAWIVVAVLVPCFYFLWRLEYRRFQRHFRGQLGP